MKTSPYGFASPALIECGYKPIPLIPHEKRPGHFNGERWMGMPAWAKYADTPLDEYEVANWQNHWPDANVGVIHTPFFIAIDFDDDTHSVHCRIQEVLGKLKGTIVRRRGSNGYIQYFKGAGVQTAVYKINGSNALEVLAKGRQSVLPPSIHPNGETYRWLTDETLEDTDVDALPALTDEVFKEIEAILRTAGWDKKEHVERKRNPSYDQDVDAGSVYSETNRRALDNLDAWIEDIGLFDLRRKANGGFEAVPTWRESNTGTPLNDRKRSLKIDILGIKDMGDDKGYSAIDLCMASLGVDDSRAWLFLNDRVGEVMPAFDNIDVFLGNLRKDDDEAVTSRKIKVMLERQRLSLMMKYSSPTTDMTNPFSSRSAGGLIGMIADYCVASSRRSPPQFAVMAGLSFAAAIYARRYQTPANGGINLYTMLLGPSGCGKDAPLRTVKRLFHEDGCQMMGGIGDITSDNAIEAVLRRDRGEAHTFVIDEIGIFLQGVQNQRASGHEARIRKAILELYSLSSGFWAGRTSAMDEDRDKDKIYWPCVGLMGVSTQTEMFRGLTIDNMSDGLLARIIYCMADTRPPSRNVSASDMTIPKALSAAMKIAVHSGSHIWPEEAKAYLRGELKGQPFHTVPWESVATMEAWQAIEEKMYALEDTRGVPEGLVNRLAENTLRVATVRALSRDGALAKVCHSDVEWGYAIVHKGLMAMTDAARAHMSSSPYEQGLNKVLSAVVENDAPVTATEILPIARGLKRSVVEDALERLVENGELSKTSRKGHHATFSVINNTKKADCP